MTDQPKALRLADTLENDLEGYDGMSIPRTCQDIADKAAAELRRLHAENEDFRATIDYLTRENAEQIGEIVALKEQRDELLSENKLLQAAGYGSGRLQRLRDQRDELLEALREMVAGDAEAIAEADALGVPFPDEMLTSYRRAVAAIAKAGGAA